MTTCELRLIEPVLASRVSESTVSRGIRRKGWARNSLSVPDVVALIPYQRSMFQPPMIDFTRHGHWPAGSYFVNGEVPPSVELTTSFLRWDSERPNSPPLDPAHRWGPASEG